MKKHKKHIEAPQGFHWMKHGKGYKLMKDPAGGFVRHAEASKKVPFLRDYKIITIEKDLFVKPVEV
ncbi:hypothetical protein [uncultured Mediterranean phage uvMED]|nr:hypothetical protein [uncultured Mediterranean phage uvMED]